MKPDNSVDPDQLASEEATWSESTLFSMQDVGIIVNQYIKYRISCLPGLDQYWAADKVSCSSTHHSDSTGWESWNSNSYTQVFS